MHPLVTFLKTNYMGSEVTIDCVGGASYTGEVFDGFDDIIGLNVTPGGIVLINANKIALIIV